jgi:hypothetical protein
MKINQLFGKVMPVEILLELLNCYGLKDLNDKHTFKKQDLVYLGTVKKINNMKETLEEYYLPCKARLYLDEMTEKKSITILRQVLRLFKYHITSKERNMNTKKVIFYMINSDEEENIINMKSHQTSKLLVFD